MSIAMVFLDRDGTVNVDRGYVFRVEEWEFTDRAAEALRLLQSAGFALAIVTNQSGIGRGYYKLADVQALHAHMQEALRNAGVHLAAIALCPHDPNVGCTCRKPQVGMARQIEEQLAETIDYSRSWTIGDKISDLNFGASLGMKTALIRSGYWVPEDIHKRPTLVVDSLFDAASTIANFSS